MIDRRRRARLALAFALLLLTFVPLPLRQPLPGSLALAAGEAPPRYRAVLLRGVPHVLQRPDFCGEACAEMALRRLGHRVTQDQVFAATGTDPALGRGAVTRELAAGLRRLGFDVGRVWYWIPATGAPRRRGLEREFAALHADLVAGVPSIVCTHFDERPGTTEHFRLVTGYDPARDEVVYQDPALAAGGGLRMRRARLHRLWPLPYHAQRHLVIRIPLRVARLALPAAPRAGHSPADFAQHVMRLKAGKLRKLRGSFTIVVEPPFVVVGDGYHAGVRRHAREVVRWAVDLLKQDFFDRDPKQIIDIFLFKDRQSYLANGRALVGRSPDTPFGFYSERARALVMNIATGAGTLVHEIVHPFVEANVQRSPPWLNEGLGSLYEACEKREGHIRGLVNWRLPALQQAIRGGRLPSFATLLAMGEGEFYGRGAGTHYAQARYLLYYLQERGKLRELFRAFLRAQQQDPSGLATLKQTLGVKDLAAFQRDWARYVLALSQ
jgi:hypothetical protein